MTNIKIENLTKAFGDRKVINNLNMEIKKGESLVIIGGSGTGKSVLIKNMIGIMHPTSGKVYYDNLSFYDASKEERKEIMSKIGVCFQGGALFDSMLIWENVAFVLTHHQKMPAKKAKEIAIETLALVGLNSDVADLYPSELSGGMQKRASITRAIATNPEIIFFDEPTSGLDPINTNLISDLIIKCSKELGSTTITITHDMNGAKRVANKVAMLYKGNIVWEGNKENMESADNPYLQQFINGKTTGPIEVEVRA